MSIIQETPSRKVRMAHLAVVGTHSTNGVAEIHSRLLRTRLLKDFAELFPERFNNKTNGVTPRRWLLEANPALAELISDAIGDAWITDLEHLAALKPLASDAVFRERFRCAKRNAKIRFTDWLRAAIRPNRRSRHDLRQPDQAYSRIQTPAAQCLAYRGAVQPPAPRPWRRFYAAHFLFRRQGGSRLSSGQAHHQTD